MLKVLGKGTTAKVYLCQDIKQPYKQVAIKIFDEFYMFREKSPSETRNEIEIL